MQITYKSADQSFSSTSILTCDIEHIERNWYLNDYWACFTEQYRHLKSDYWNDYFVDENLDIFIHGGSDIQPYGLKDNVLPPGAWWPGLTPGQSLSGLLGYLLLGQQNFFCSLERPCTHNLDCRTIGFNVGPTTGPQTLKSLWGYYVMASLLNINYQLKNQ